MSNHPANETCMQPCDDMTQHGKIHQHSGRNCKDNQYFSQEPQPTQICFGSWSDAFDESEVALPPPKIFVGRGLRSRPQAIPLLLLSKHARTLQHELGIIAESEARCLSLKAKTETNGPPMFDVLSSRLFCGACDCPAQPLVHPHAPRDARFLAMHNGFPKQYTCLYFRMVNKSLCVSLALSFSLSSILPATLSPPAYQSITQ